MGGRFNARSPLWGSGVRDLNGEVVENFMDGNNLVCLNDGRPTRFDIRTSRLSCIDLALASAVLARVGEWDNQDRCTIGSDHFLILLKFGKSLIVEEQIRPKALDFSKARWSEFVEGCNRDLDQVNEEGSVDERSVSLCEIIMRNVRQYIPLKVGVKKRVSVPWWTRACTEAAGRRNRSYRLLRKFPTEQNAIEYKRMRALARRTIKEAKRECWRKYCSKLGVETSVVEVWSAVHRMAGVCRRRLIPVLVENGVEAFSDSQKANMLARKFQEIHCGDNIGEEGIRERNKTLRNQEYKCEVNNDNSDPVNLFFSMTELENAISRGGKTAPGKDGLGYEIFKKFDEAILCEILALINNVWETGELPASWKHAVVVPILKAKKEAKSPGSYRPIALTAVMCKIMERMVTDRLVYKLEKEGRLTNMQNGFRLGRGTMDSVLLLESGVQKALSGKEGVVAVFLDIEKAYDMLWREGLVTKLYDAGIRSRMLNWIKVFFARSKDTSESRGCIFGYSMD